MAENFDGDKGLAKLREKKYGEVGQVTVNQRKLADGDAGVDRRTLRKTGRVELFSARVTAETKKGLHAYAKAHNKLLGEVLEDALELLLKKR